MCALGIIRCDDIISQGEGEGEEEEVVGGGAVDMKEV